MEEASMSNQFQLDPPKPPTILILTDQYNVEHKNYQQRYPEDQYSRKIEDFLITAWQKSGVFNGVCHTPRKLDEDEGIDIFVELPSGKIIAVDITFTHDPRKQEKKAGKLSWPAEQIKGFESKGKIPIVPFPFDEQKYRGWKERYTAESIEAQIETTAILKEMVVLKKDRELNLEHRSAKQTKIKEFYQGYLEELDKCIGQLKEKLKNEPAQQDDEQAHDGEVV